MFDLNMSALSVAYLRWSSIVVITLECRKSIYDIDPFVCKGRRTR